MYTEMLITLVMVTHR